MGAIVLPSVDEEAKIAMNAETNAGSATNKEELLREIIDATNEEIGTVEETPNCGLPAVPLPVDPEEETQDDSSCSIDATNMEGEENQDCDLPSDPEEELLREILDDNSYPNDVRLAAKQALQVRRLSNQRRAAKQKEEVEKVPPEVPAPAPVELEPMDMIRKGAVAAVGGTLTAVGLVMIPLPTPFGAVVASSGLAVLGTEFDEAKELNDRLIDGAKGHLSNARAAIVRGIERMDPGELDDEVDSDSDSDNRDSDDDKKEAVQPVSADSARSDNNEGNTSGDGENKSNDKSANPIVQDRQEQMQKSYEQTREYITKRTGKFLSRNVLPLLKEKSPADEQETTAAEAMAVNAPENDETRRDDCSDQDNKEESCVAANSEGIASNDKEWVVL